MSSQDSSGHAAIYGRVLELCQPFACTRPWDFLAPDADCRRPIGDPDSAFAILRAEFSEADLESAKVVQRKPDGNRCLSPSLCNPVGAVIAFRKRPDDKPFDLITARGCLSGASPALLAMNDAWTLARIKETGTLYASYYIAEVVLLRATGVPATLATGLHRGPLDVLQALDTTFGEQRPFLLGGQCAPTTSIKEQAPSTAQTSDHINAETKSAPSPQPIKPSFAFVAWSPWLLRDRVPRMLDRTVKTLALARQNLGLNFRGIWVWRASRRKLDNLRFRLKYRQPTLIHELLLETSCALEDFESLLDSDEVADAGTAPAPDFIKAQANLLAILADDRKQGRVSDRVHAARRCHEALIERDQVAPLQAWALNSSDPVVRSTGLAVADVCRQLHRLSPLVNEMLARQWEQTLVGGNVAGVDKLIAGYLQLLKHLACLVGILCHASH